MGEAIPGALGVGARPEESGPLLGLGDQTSPVGMSEQAAGGAAVQARGAEADQARPLHQQRLAPPAGERFEDGGEFGDPRPMTGRSLPHGEQCLEQQRG